MKHKILILLCSLSILFSTVPVYADDPFEGWNDENQENVWAVMETTDWTKMQDFLTLEKINSTVSAEVSDTVRGYEAEIRRVINSSDIEISDGLVELMLALLQVMGGDNPPTDDPYNVKIWIDPSVKNLNAEKSIEKVLFKLDAARKVHPEPDQISYFVNSEELCSVIQGIVLTTRYTQENAKYSLESATAFYNAHKDEFEKKGLVPSLTFANDVSAIFKTTNVSGAGGGTSSAINVGLGTTINAVGTQEGIEVLNYAAQFIGNPYVYGGNSLTNGIDCSGFTQQVFAHFGYNLPRVSDAQATSGVGISYEEARAGDIIVYPGHVAILTGEGGIIHASNSKPYPKGGIKYTANALYTNYIAVRRILQ